MRAILARTMVAPPRQPAKNGDIRAFFGAKTSLNKRNLSTIMSSSSSSSSSPPPLSSSSSSSSSSTLPPSATSPSHDTKRLRLTAEKENVVDNTVAVTTPVDPVKANKAESTTESDPHEQQLLPAAAATEQQQPDGIRTSASAITTVSTSTASTASTAVSVEVAVAVAVAGADLSTPTTYGNFYQRLDQLMDASWHSHLQKEFAAPYFKRLVTFLHQEHTKKQSIFPPAAHVFAALRDSRLHDLKVVILGQDPYHGPNQAHGLCFSVQPGIAIPPSLRNIYKECHQDVGLAIPSHGCLSAWSHQGVLLLNNVLTVRRAQANSHKNQGWEQFTDAVIRCVNQKTSNVVFLLWGKPAQEKGAIINTSKHLVLKSSHPSPLGATKTNAPFIGSRCFSKTNQYLRQHGKDPIDWNVL